MTAGPKPEYEPKTVEQRIGYLVEEAGEVSERLGDVLAAAGKSIRWGLEGSNPELPPEHRETNREWLLRALTALEPELADLAEAIKRAREGLL